VLALCAAVGSLGVLVLVLVIGNAGLSDYPNDNPSGWWWLPIVAGVAVAALSMRVLVLAPTSRTASRLAKTALAALGAIVVVACGFVVFYASSSAEEMSPGHP
jgi:hypothetical protein